MPLVFSTAMLRTTSSGREMYFGSWQRSLGVATPPLTEARCEMEIHQLRYAVEIARHQSFTRAAEAIPVSVASVSEAVRNLESELGVALFERTTRRVRPTSAGYLFLEHAEKVLAELNAARRNLYAYRQARTESVTLGTPPTSVVWNLPFFLQDFRRANPSIEVRMVEGSTRQLVQALRSWEVDLTFLTGPPGCVPNDADSHELERLETGIAVAPSHSLASRETVELSEIADMPMVVSQPGFAMREIAIEVFSRAEIRPKIAFETSEMEMLQGFVRAGAGFTIMVRARAEAVGLAFLRCSPRPLDRILAIAWLRSRPLTPAAELLRNRLYDGRRHLALYGHHT